MTFNLIDKLIPAGRSVAQRVGIQLGALLKAEFDNQYNLYGNEDRFNVDIYLNNHGIYQKYLEDAASTKALINILFDNAKLDTLINDGTADTTYIYRLQLVTRANANATSGEDGSIIGTDNMLELISIIEDIMTYYANMRPPIQLNNMHHIKISNYQVGSPQEYTSVDRCIGCVMEIEVAARKNPLLSDTNDLQGFNIELDYNNKIINLTIDT